MAVFKNQAHWRERKKKIAKQNPGTSQPARTFFFHPSWKKTTKQPSKQSPPPSSSKLLTQQRRRQTSPSGHGIHLKGWFSRQSSSSPTTFFTRAERDFWALRVRAGSTFMTTRSGRAATPCEHKLKWYHAKFVAISPLGSTTESSRVKAARDSLGEASRTMPLTPARGRETV